MLKNSLSILLFFKFLILNAQVSEVKEEVENAYEYYQDAFSKIKNAKSYITDAFNEDSIDDIQSYASYAEDELNSAKTYISYAEDEADDAEDEAASLNCDDAEKHASDAEDYFYEAKNKLSSAISELSSASYEDDTDSLSDYLNNASSYINDAINSLSYAVDELNNTLKNINNCGVPSDSNYYSNSNNTPSCQNLLNYIQQKGYHKDTLSNYTLDSEWLYEGKAYDLNRKIYIIAKIKKNEYSYQTNTYIFCDIPSSNWYNFKNGDYGDSESYGNRFHKYIINHKCDCY